jgi:hypothetical protein
MIEKRSAVSFVVLVLCIMLFVPSVSFSKSKNEILINAGDVQSLKAVVANSYYAGYRVVLEAGTYVLDETLVLQPDMDLIGKQEWESLDENGIPLGIVPETATIIDGSSIARQTVIFAGLNNRIEKLTLINSSYWNFTNGYVGVVQLNEVSPKYGYQLAVRDCILNAPYILKVMYAYMGSANDGLRSSLTLERNIVGGADDFFQPVQISIVSSDNTQITASLEKSRFSGGFSALGLGTGGNRNTVNISSTFNICEKADAGISLSGGTATCVPGIEEDAVGNSVLFTSLRDVIQENGNAGLYIAGGNIYWGSCAAKAELNTVTAVLTDTKFSNNGPEAGRVDILAAGLLLVDAESHGNRVKIITENIDSDLAVRVDKAGNYTVQKSVLEIGEKK